MENAEGKPQGLFWKSGPHLGWCLEVETSLDLKHSLFQEGHEG